MSIIAAGGAHRGSVRGFYPKTINGSLRFNDDDSAYLSWTPASAGNRKTWTFSCWFKPTSTFTTARALFSAGTGTTDATFGQILLSNDSTIRVNGYSTTWRGTSRLFRDPSAWYHLVVLFDTTQATAADRVKVYINGTQETAFDINNNPTQNADYAFNQSAVHYIGRIDSAIGTNYLNEYLAELFFIDGTAHTASDFGQTNNGVWVPKNITASSFTMGTNGFYLNFLDDTQVEAFNTTLYRGNGGTQSLTGTGFSPDLVWIKNRDNADNHYLYDTVRGANRYLNSDTTGAEAYSSNDLNSFDADGFTVGSDGGLNRSGQAIVAWCWDAGANNASTGHSSVTYTGASSDQHITGFGFDPDLVWVKKRNGAVGHSLSDSVRGATKSLFSDSTDAEDTGANIRSFIKDGFVCNSGSQRTGNNGDTYVAWAWDAGDSDPVSNTTGDTAATVKTNGDFSIMAYAGTGAATSIGHGLSSAPNFVIVKDRSAAQNWVVWTDDINTNGNQYLELNQTSAIQSSSVFWNSTAPDASKIYLGTSNSVSGRNFICYAWRNVTGKQQFGSYEGNNTATGPTVNVGFRPGFVMIKNADGTGNWNIFDGSRFPFANNDLFLRANLAAAEVDGSGEGADAYEVEFTSNGFIPKASGASSRSQVNGTGTYIYAAFAGSYSDYITNYNTDGTVDSRVKASQTYGFSICSFNSGASGTRSFGHGLGTTPSLCIFKERNSGGAGDHWVVWEGMTGNPATSYGYLNLGNAFGTDTSQWSNTAPTSTEFTFNSGYAWSTDQDMIAYCWAEKTGYSKFGSYSGGTTNNKITTNFKPAMVIIKRTDSTADWQIFDNTRDTSNPITARLNPNQSYAELTNGDFDIVSDGFELNNISNGWNASGGTYIYAAFADTRDAAFWLDQSSNNNDWQPNNLDYNDTGSDSPTNNFATLNPLDSAATLSDGNLKVTSSSAAWKHAKATIAMTSGKWYWETVATTSDASNGYVHGVSTTAFGNTNDPNSASTGLYARQSAVKYTNGSVNSSGFSSTSAGDVLNWAFDADAGKLWVGVNGNFIGDPAAGTGESWSSVPSGVFCLVGFYNQNGYINFGQQPFKYDPPA